MCVRVCVCNVKCQTWIGVYWCMYACVCVCMLVCVRQGVCIGVCVREGGVSLLMCAYMSMSWKIKSACSGVSPLNHRIGTFVALIPNSFLSFTKDDWRKVSNKKFAVMKCGVAKSSFWRIFEKYLMVRSRSKNFGPFFWGPICQEFWQKHFFAKNWDILHYSAIFRIKAYFFIIFIKIIF
jgi:hypothetical protein